MNAVTAITSKIGQLDKVEEQFKRGLITERDACREKVRVLGDASELIRTEILATLERLGL